MKEKILSFLIKHCYVACNTTSYSILEPNYKSNRDMMILFIYEWYGISIYTKQNCNIVQNYSTSLWYWNLVMTHSAMSRARPRLVISVKTLPPIQVSVSWEPFLLA